MSSDPQQQQQQLLLVFAFVAVVAIALTNPDALATLVCVGAVLSLVWMLMEQTQGAGPGPPGGPAWPSWASRSGSLVQLRDGTLAHRPSREGFFTEQAPPPYAASAVSYPGELGAPARRGGAPPRPSRAYPGAIDADEYDAEKDYGFRDRTEGDNEVAADGNPFNLGRVGAPAAAAACLDDEANDDEMDGDERATYQGRARNDDTRAIAGLMNRRKVMDGYLREELTAAEDERWWGRHEV